MGQSRSRSTSVDPIPDSPRVAHFAELDDWNPIVLDIGSSRVTAGYPRSDAPRAWFPHVVGRVRTTDTSGPQLCVGYDAQSKCAMLNLSSPMVGRRVVDWEALSLVLKHTLVKELGVEPEEHFIVVTIPPIVSSKEFVERVAQIMFGQLDVGGICFVSPPVYALHANGRTSGIVVDSGQNSTAFIPVKDGKILSHAVRTMDIGGLDLTNHLARLLAKRGCNFKERDVVRDMKEQLCFVSLDCTAQPIEEKAFELPDGKSLTLGNERFLCPEALFDTSLLWKSFDTWPSLRLLWIGQKDSASVLFNVPKDVLHIIERAYLRAIGFDDVYRAVKAAKGIQHVLLESINACDPSVRNEVSSNVLLVGGNTNFTGIADRLSSEMKTVPFDIRIRAPPERKFSNYLGACQFASTLVAREKCVTREEYQASGAVSLEKFEY